MLVNPWLTFGLSLILALLVLIALLLPQLPTQLQTEASAGERWLINAAAVYGPPGEVMRALGLFTILTGPLLQVLLASLSFVLLLQLVHQAVGAYRLYRLPTVLGLRDTINGIPLPVRAPDRLLRWRAAHDEPPLATTAQIQRLLEARLRQVERRTSRVAAAPIMEYPGIDELHGESHMEVTSVVLEERLLAQRGRSTAMLRPLLVLGMLCAVGMLWLYVGISWSYTADVLIPGERAADAVHAVRLEYRVNQAGTALLAPTLVASVGDSAIAIPVASEMSETLDGVAVEARQSGPALWVQTADGTPLLARPGQLNPVTTIGLGFPNAGSEETLLLPTLGTGLRIVRDDRETLSTDDYTFWVEVFHGDSEQAVARISVGGSQVEYIETPTGLSVALAFVTLPGLHVQVHYAPGLWLFGLALGLAAIGLVGFWVSTDFLVAQIGPWPEERTVITLQSNLADMMTSIQRWHAEEAAAIREKAASDSG